MSDVYIGRYRVIEEIGRGGMGIVYRAEDPALDRPVAIKVLPPKKTAQQKAVKRFLREARVCARLDHPNIIKVHDIGEEEGIYHIVMELVEGSSLRELIESRETIHDIDIDYMTQVFKEACDALAYAHDKQIIHRDIKPDNIMLTTEGRVKVMDFGLAVLEDRHSLTEMGQVMGTVAYFSPEQARGDPADHRSDIYSLGAVFFEMITNQLVFQAKNPGEMITKHLSSPPPNPKIYNPAIPPVLTNLVLLALKKNPAERPQSVNEMLDVLNEWIETRKSASRSQLAPPPLPKADLKMSSPGRQKTEEIDTDKIRSQEKDGGLYDSSHLPETLIEEKERLPAQEKPSRRDVPEGGSFARPHQDPAQQTEAPRFHDRSHDTITKIPVNPPKADTEKGTPVLPTSGESPVASSQWMKEAQQGDEWSKHQHVIDQIKKDQVAREVAGVGEATLLCPRCGAENAVSRKYCSDCGNILTQTEYISQKEAIVHLEKGKELMVAGKMDEAVTEFQLAVEADSDLLEAYVSLGKILGDKGDYKRARSAYRNVSRLQPSDPKPHVQMADLYRLEKRRDDAIFEYREAAKLAPSDITIRNQLALLYSQKGDIERAIDEYQRILTVDPKNVEAHRQLGYMFMARERNEEAIREFEWVISVDPGDDQVNQVLGTLYIKTNRLRNAEKSFQTILTLKPDDTEAIAALGEIYEKQNRPDLALEHLGQAIQKNAANVDARKKLADLYLRHDRPQLALKEFEQAVNFRPEDPELHRNLGDLYLKGKQVDKALLHFERTVALSPANAELHHKLATLYKTKEYSELSINEYKKAVDLEPYNSEYREELGMALYTARRSEEAISEMRKATTLDSTNLDYQKALGIMYEENEQLDLAEQQFKKIISKNPKDAMSHGMLGQIYSKRNFYSMAIVQFQKALQLDPKSHLFYIYLGKVYAKQGKQDDAVECYQRAIELDPGTKDAKGSKLMAKAYTDLGRVYMEQGELEKALDVLKSAEEHYSSEPRTLHFMGLVYTDQGNFKMAHEYLTKALKQQPHNAEIMRDLAHLYQQKGDVTMALSLVKKSVILAPMAIEGYETLAKLLSRTDRYAEAQQTLSDAVRNCPGDVDYAYWLKGNYAVDKREWQKAENFYRQAISYNENDWRYHRDLATVLDEIDEPEQAYDELQMALNLGPDEDSEPKMRQDLKRLKKKRKVEE